MEANRLDYEQIQRDLFARTESYAFGVQKAYRSAFSQIVDLVKDVELIEGKPFSFSEYGFVDKVTAILRSLYSTVYHILKSGIEKEWLTSNKHNDELVKSVFGTSSIEDSHFARFFHRNKEAMDAFLLRKTGQEGLNLSQKVWRYTGAYKHELENTLDLAIGEGTPANQLAKRVQLYLNDPDRYYRRFRVKVGEDEYGNTIYGSKWKRRIWDKEDKSYKWVDDNLNDFHPGRGVYRSSFRNAQRLARSETNIAYHTANYERWRQLDFIVQIEVKLSNNHTLNGVHFVDICDDLKGVYPKWFKYTGWHTCCRCYAIPVLANREDIDKLIDNLIAGNKEYTYTINSKEEAELPPQFTKWMQDNQVRYEKAKEKGTLPYFIRDNAKKWHYQPCFLEETSRL